MRLKNACIHVDRAKEKSIPSKYFEDINVYMDVTKTLSVISNSLSS